MIGCRASKSITSADGKTGNKVFIHVFPPDAAWRGSTRYCGPTRKFTEDETAALASAAERERETIRALGLIAD
ncbi:MAG: hypothetical protein QM811_25550 [Pirellulales bacterium]